jgi:hypothetical protein
MMYSSYGSFAAKAIAIGSKLKNIVTVKFTVIIFFLNPCFRLCVRLKDWDRAVTTLRKGFSERQNNYNEILVKYSEVLY